MKKYLLLLFIISSLSLFAQKEFYELRAYTIPFNGSEQALHTYFKDAFLPALNRAGVQHIGVFEALGAPTPKQLYLLIPYQDITTYSEVVNALAIDPI